MAKLPPRTPDELFERYGPLVVPDVLAHARRAHEIAEESKVLACKPHYPAVQYVRALHYEEDHARAKQADLEARARFEQRWPSQIFLDVHRLDPRDADWGRPFVRWAKHTAREALAALRRQFGSGRGRRGLKGN